MTISVVQHVGTTGTSTSSLTVSLSATTQGNTIAVIFGGTGSADSTAGLSPVSISFASDTFYPIGTVNYPPMYCFFDPDCAGGQTSLTINYTASGTVGVFAYVYEISGLGSNKYILDQFSPGSVSQSANTPQVPSGFIQTTNATEIVLGCTSLYFSSTPSWTAPAGFTNATGLTFNFGSGQDLFAQAGYQVTSSTGTYGYLVSSESQYFNGASFTFSLAAAPISPTTPLILQAGSNAGTAVNSATLTDITTFNNELTPGNLIVYAVEAYAYTGTAPTISSVKLEPSGTSMSQATLSSATTSYPTVGIFYAVVPSGNTGVAVTCTGSTAADNLIQITGWEIEGTLVTLDQSGSTHAASNAPSITSGSTTALNELIIGAIGYSAATSGQSVTPAGTPWAVTSTAIDVSSSHYGTLLGAVQIGSSETTYTYSASIGASEDWVAQIATLNITPPAGPAGANTDIPQIQPGPTWFKLFKPFLPKPAALTQPEYTIPGRTSTASAAMAALAFGTCTVNVNNPFVPAVDQLQIRPGPTWLALFKPGWKNKPPLAAAPPSGPWINQLPSYTDVPQFNPGPTWLAHFKPWIPKRPVSAPPAPYQNPGSTAMAPYAMSATATVYPTMRGGAQMAPLMYGASNTVHVPVITNGSMALAPTHFSGTVAVPIIVKSASMALAPMAIYTPPTVRDVPQFNPGPTWVARFKPWTMKRKLKISGGPSWITCRAGMAMAAPGFSSTLVSQYEPFPQFPLQLKYEILVNGTWIDITSYVYSRNAQVITRGLPDETQSATPSQMTLTLNNRDGRFSPNNQFGAYYPYLTRNIQLRCSINNQASTGGQSLYSGYRFWGEVSSWPPRWDPTGRDVYCQVVVSGPLRRFVQGAKLGSTLYQYYAGLGSSQFAPYAVWPCEDVSGSTEIASALPGTPSMTFTGAPQFASNAAFGGSDPLPVIASSTWNGLTIAAEDPPGTGSILNVSPGTYFWVCPPGVTAVTGMICIGGGGGGGDTDGTTGGGGGGGGGSGTASSVGVTAGTKYFYTVPAGGTTTAKAAGGTGANASFAGDTQTVTGLGGTGGQYGGSGGSGGTGGAGPIYNGGNGAAGGAGSAGSGGTSEGGGSQSLYGTSGGGQTSTSWTAPSDLTGDVSFSCTAGGGGGGGGYVGVQYDNAGGGGGSGNSGSGTVTASPGGSVNFYAGNGGTGGNATNSGTAGSGGVGGYSGTDSQTFPAGHGGGGGGSGGPGGGGAGAQNGQPGTGSIGSGTGGAGGGGGYGAGGSGGSTSSAGAYNGNPGSPGYITWTWTTSDSFTIPPVPSNGGGGGGSGGSSTSGNNGSGGTGGAAVTGGGAGGTDSPSPVGHSPGGGGAGADPGTNTGTAATAGAGAPGAVGFAWTGGVTSPVAADIIRFCLDVDSAGAVDGAVLLSATTYGTVQTLNVIYHTGGNLELVGLNASNATLFDSGSIGFSANGTPLYVDVELTQSGTGATWLLQAIKPGATSVVASATGTVASVSVGNVSAITVDPAGAITDNATSIGWITVQTYADTLVNLSPVVNGYAGETAAARMSRLCGNADIGFTLVGSASDTPMMGPQQDDTFVNVMQSCSDFDRGQLFETRNQFGIGYRTRINMQNQSPKLSVDYTLATLSGDLEPTADDQFTRNDITLTRSGGASSRAYLATGSMSIQTPPSGVGDYTYSLTVYAYSDTQLPVAAGWMLGVGTVPEYHYPTLEFDLARAEVAALLGTIPSLDIGDYIQVINPPVFLQLAPINQLFWGVIETLNTYTWTIAINTVPEDPYTGVFSTW